MKLIAPDYYPQFKCIAELCKHSCCIGWEIDIDEDTHAFYRSVESDFGKRLSENISDGEAPCFVLDEHERCPFLNQNGLCDIIIELGEDALCQICSDHPRFRNFYDDRVEIGLGLCCEAAAELIINCSHKVKLVEIKNDGCDSESDSDFFKLRDGIFDIIQNRDMPFDDRISLLLSSHRVQISEKSLADWADFYVNLEQLDSAWSEKIIRLKTTENISQVVSDTALEQLLVYFIYRHLADGLYDGRIKERLAFAVLSVRIINALCSVCGESVTEIARMYSSEIEYSEENLDALLDALSIKLRLACEDEVPLCMEFIDDARAHQREQGFMQWTDTSPNIGHVVDDIKYKRGYFLTFGDKPLGYLCLSFDGEPVYGGLEGKWLSDSEYAVIHRLAFGKAARGKGASRDVFRLAEEICIDRGVHSLRIDTHENNKKMRHIIEREGFTYCGTVYYNSSPRMAFEKII